MDTRLDNHWDVFAREYRWRDPVSQDDKYADLVLGRGDIMRMVIECKRLQDTSWVFLQPEDEQKSRPVKLYWCHTQVDEPYLAGWDDFGVKDSYPHSEFCIQQTKGQRLVLENLAGELLRSIEYLAAEDASTSRSTDGAERMFLPVIVTTAPLHVVAFKASDIDLAGLLRGDQANVESVPCVAFRKSLTTSAAARDLGTLRRRYGREPNLTIFNLDNERTVFVVNVDYLTRFLSEIRVSNLNRLSGKWPWEIAHELLRASSGMGFA